MEKSSFSTKMPTRRKKHDHWYRITQCILWLGVVYRFRLENSVALFSGQAEPKPTWNTSRSIGLGKVMLGCVEFWIFF